MFAAAGVEVVTTPPWAPKANGYAERWVRTVRAECLDWRLMWNRRHLERVLRRYLEHYNSGCPHRGINLQAPMSSGLTPVIPLPVASRVERVDVLGGLIPEYRRAA